METPSELLTSPDPTTANPESSSTFLQFPTPVADKRVPSWVQSTSEASMSGRSGASADESLSESTYEFIDTDEESRDDNATESVASTDFGRPDDIASLADTDGSGDDSGDEDSQNPSAIPAFAGQNHDVDHAFDTPTIGRSRGSMFEDLEKPLVQSIEFQEPFSLGAENVSVKHTVTNFNEEQTASVVQKMTIQNPPQRLVITIRQTMTKQGLSTRDPLRILYVGSHSAKQDIIHKIASSVTASVESGTRAQHPRHSPSQLYNVVPVSAFGSERTPEIELMHSSGYQINVEDCTLAQTLKFEEFPEKPDVIKLTLEDNYSYHSVPEGQGFIVEPHWDLPHVAVFYCTDGDNVEAKRTRTIARKFMSRHGVTSIVISHRQLFDRGNQCMSLDQHSIHMCLESRDPDGRGNIIHQRLPIDLASFLNIDARQMNRNLAYVTGLHESLEAPKLLKATKNVEHNPVNPEDPEKSSYSISDSVNFIRSRNGAEWRAFLPVGVLLLGVFVAVLTGVPSYRSSSTPAISVNSKFMSAVPISTTAPTLTSTVPSITSISTSVAVKTSTRTVTVTESQAPAGPNSVAVLPSMELGKVSRDVHHHPKPLNKSSLCTAEVLGDREILIRIPSATKLSWLTKEAMSVNITRGNITVETERAYSSDDGIILLLPKKEAHGILNVSIITTKKPRVNETFQVDFRITSFQAMQSALEKLSSLWANHANVFDPQSFTQMRTVAQKLIDDTRIHSQPTYVRLGEVKRAFMKRATSSSALLAELAKSMSLDAARQSAIISKELGIQLAKAEAKLSEKLQSLDRLQEPMENLLMKAQVQSKLLWLKIQGKDVEYREYEQRATEATHYRTQSWRNFQNVGSVDRKATRGQRLVKKVAKRASPASKKSAKKSCKKAEKKAAKQRV